MTILVTGPVAARVAVIFGALVSRLPGSDRARLGGLVLVMTDPVARARRRALEGDGPSPCASAGRTPSCSVARSSTFPMPR